MNYIQPIITSHNAPNQRGIVALSQEIARSGWRRPFAAQAEHSVRLNTKLTLSRRTLKIRAQARNESKLASHTRGRADKTVAKSFLQGYAKRQIKIHRKLFSSRQREALIKKSAGLLGNILGTREETLIVKTGVGVRRILQGCKFVRRSKTFGAFS